MLFVIYLSVFLNICQNIKIVNNYKQFTPKSQMTVQSFINCREIGQNFKLKSKIVIPKFCGIDPNSVKMQVKLAERYLLHSLNIIVMFCVEEMDLGVNACTPGCDHQNIRNKILKTIQNGEYILVAMVSQSCFNNTRTVSKSNFCKKSGFFMFKHGEKFDLTLAYDFAYVLRMEESNYKAAKRNLEQPGIDTFFLSERSSFEICIMLKSILKEDLELKRDCLTIEKEEFLFLRNLLLFISCFLIFLSLKKLIPIFYKKLKKGYNKKKD
ncbi:hypothetical protein MHBO_001202 [Bonamia ostreae]|uniref:Uncharacterized protein n=1 Tax=Bonamia ostreae TaxID=126728 RepID=A0ABV2AI46_9EUKA